MRGLGDRVDVVDLDVRVADGLDIHGLGLVVDQLLIGFWVAPVRDEPGFDAVIRKEPVEQLLSRAVNRGGCDDIAFRTLRQCEQGIGDRGHARRDADRCDTTVQRGQTLLHDSHRRVADATVVKATLLARPQTNRPCGVTQIEGGGLIDGR